MVKLPLLLNCKWALPCPTPPPPPKECGQVKCQLVSARQDSISFDNVWWSTMGWLFRNSPFQLRNQARFDLFDPTTLTLFSSDITT